MRNIIILLLLLLLSQQKKKINPTMRIKEPCSRFFVFLHILFFHFSDSVFFCNLRLNKLYGKLFTRKFLLFRFSLSGSCNFIFIFFSARLTKNNKEFFLVFIRFGCYSPLLAFCQLQFTFFFFIFFFWSK